MVEEDREMKKGNRGPHPTQNTAHSAHEDLGLVLQSSISIQLINSHRHRSIAHPHFAGSEQRRPWKSMKQWGGIGRLPHWSDPICRRRPDSPYTYWIHLTAIVIHRIHLPAAFPHFTAFNIDLHATLTPSTLLNFAGTWRYHCCSPLFAIQPPRR